MRRSTRCDCSFSATLRHNLRTLKPKSSTAAARPVQFQARLSGVRASNSELRGIAMLRRFLAGGACAVGLLAVVSAMPAAANPYDAQVRGSGRSLLSTLFGPSIARTTVSYTGTQKPGTIIISTAQRRLYLVLGNGQALSYAIGVGREGMAWSGVTQISSKREWPDWTPPDQMLKRRP